VENDTEVSGLDTLALMTIASYCLELLREHGPLSADELGAACRDAGVTASRQPAQAVTSALRWRQDGQVLCVQGRFHAVTELLDGRWLTFGPPADASTVKPGLDLACLQRLVERHGLPLAGGGTVRALCYSDTWTGPEGWLVLGATLGLKMIDGAAHVSVVVLDEAAKKRGEALAELLADSSRQQAHGYSERLETAGPALLALLAGDDDLLREPVPPLSALLPAPRQERARHSVWEAPPFWPTVPVHLPPELYDRFDDVARDQGVPVGHWLAEQLEKLAHWPYVRPGRIRGPGLAAYDAWEGPFDDCHDDCDCGPRSELSPSVLPFMRPGRGGPT
jgi:hypothetical protein